jgi:hypothetical protein
LPAPSMSLITPAPPAELECSVSGAGEGADFTGGATGTRQPAGLRPVGEGPASELCALFLCHPERSLRFVSSRAKPKATRILALPATPPFSRGSSACTQIEYEYRST